MVFRALVAGAFLFVAGVVGSAQEPGILHITITIVDADQHARPVPRHALLISDNPTTTAPRRVVTALDGSAELRLRPGNYTVESEQPLMFQGKSYQWMQMLDVAAGKAALLELTAGNAQIEAAAAGAASPDPGAARAEMNAAALLVDWQKSVVSIWSPTRLGAGFLIDARGLIATNQRLVGKATAVEVQLSSTKKVAGRVLAADAFKNVAIVWVDPRMLNAAKPVKLGYADGGSARITEQDQVYALTAPLHDDQRMASGPVKRVNVHTIFSDVRLEDDSLGAPLFDASGLVIAITTPEDDAAGASYGSSRAIRIDDLRTLVTDAEKKMTGQGPGNALLPVESAPSVPDDVLKDAAARHTAVPVPYRMSASDFEISVITPPLVYAAQHRRGRTTGRGSGRVDAAQMQESLRALEDFGNWSGYASDYPPVIMIRVTPKLVEGFWTSVARGAAQTQGVSLPPIKHVKAGFSRLRAFCGDVEVRPIHPLQIEQRFAEGKVIYEGLYVFDPAAIGPQCGAVKLILYSDREPDKGDTRVVDVKILQEVAQDVRR